MHARRVSREVWRAGGVMIHAFIFGLLSWSHGFGACGDRRAGAWHGGAAGPGLKSKPVLDLGEFRPVRAGAGRLARMLSYFP